MGLFDLGINFANLQRGGTMSMGATQNAGLSIPQLGNPSPAVAKAPVPSVMSSSLGSGNSNFQGFDPTAFANIAPQALTPTYCQDLNALTGVGANFNRLC